MQSDWAGPNDHQSQMINSQEQNEFLNQNNNLISNDIEKMQEACEFLLGQIDVEQHTCSQGLINNAGDVIDAFSIAFENLIPEQAEECDTEFFILKNQLVFEPLDKMC